MLDALAGTVFVFLIILGTVAVCYVFMLKLLLPKSSGRYYIVIPFDSGCSDVRKNAYGMRIKLNLLGDENRAQIVVLDKGIGEDEKKDVSEICTEKNGIFIVENEKIGEFLNGRI